jgi:DMSO/TMAO reductase YedYZ molybdopterin-dependent catalytic subunit
VLHGLERLSIALLSGAALFELVTGLLNIAYWYGAMPFGFIGAHYWTAWLAIGALLLHVAVKLPLALRPAPDPAGRRSVLALAGAAAAVVTVAFLGQTVRPLRRVSLLAPRLPDVGPQGVPVNKTAAAAGVTRVDDGYRLTVVGPGSRHALTLADLQRLPQYTVSLPISCVEGWSAGAQWTGVRVADLLKLVGGSIGNARVRVDSLQRTPGYGSSVLEPGQARDPLTLLALRVGGEPLHLDHGYPCRLIAPNRPGALQTKWVTGFTVMSA